MHVSHMNFTCSLFEVLKAVKFAVTENCLLQRLYITSNCGLDFRRIYSSREGIYKFQTFFASRFILDFSKEKGIPGKKGFIYDLMVISFISNHKI